jgi:predicted alpha/beta-fold hydrolase
MTVDADARPPGDYVPPPFMANGHVQSLFPSLCRYVPFRFTRRERIDTPDDDFLDVDWAITGARRLAVLCHGLEGNSRRPYMLGMARALCRRGWDCLALNYRGCSGAPNRRLRFYHSGAFEDLALVVNHAGATGRYDAVVLIGFSVGGNIVLRWLGSRPDRVHPLVRRAVVFSVPCDLADSAAVLARPQNRLYMRHFLVALRQKIREKMAVMPGRINDDGYARLATFKDFDDRYTAPLNGFESAEDYWRRCSSKPVIPGIRIPTLMIQAKNDPFLGPGCYPLSAVSTHPMVTLDIPDSGGHVGFISFNTRGEYWSERRALSFASCGSGG